MSATPQILGFALFLAVAFLWALIIGLCRAAKSHRPAEATPPAGSAGRCTTPQCWSSGPRGGHAYAPTVDGVRTCLRCGDEVRIPRWQG